ncbi:MAG TPA: PEP/pyruvate-binding domain-containing protein [Thermoanaerobaculia bacterium]|nr:PEP/pyruvate-binding domain-containing protein [Thermoanaerobaculia bacterium]
MASAREIGGKAANLLRLQQLGFRVPPFTVVTSDAAVILSREDGEGPAADSAGVVHRRGSFAVSAAQDDTVLYAVRSSAIGEDAAGLSFAGIHESLLFVREHELDAAIAHVRASARSERANAYRAQHGIAHDDTPMPVVVQRMIDARVSGVVFTAHPTSGDVHEVVISALFGLGEGLVSEGFDADTFVVQKDDLSIATEVAEKTERIVFDRAKGSGTKREQVSAPHARSLTDDEVRELARTAIAIENAFGRPQDIEFAFDASGLYILQARPITTANEYGPAAGNRMLWDNSNIVESFSGVTSPMTFSVIRRAYAIVYKLFAEVMGIPPATVRAHQPVFENMLGIFRGQVFYNLLNWYALVRLFPGYEQNRAFMEQMMGVSKSLGSTIQPRTSKLALLPIALRMLRNFAGIDKHVAEFEANFKSHYERWSRADFDALKPHELMQLYSEFEDRVLWSWRAPIINDFFVMIFYGTLKKLSENWCGEASLQNDLLAGEGGIESAEPAKMLLRFAELARPDAALCDAIDGGDLARIRRDFPEFSQELDRYLELYGFRCMNELKLEEQSLRDRPELLLTFIRNYLAAPPKPVDESRIRVDAERRAIGALRSPLRRAVFRFVLKRARIGVRNRENMRFARTRIFGLVREVVRAFGRRLHEEQLLDSADDVFYLGLDELWDYVKGTALTTDLRALAAVRRKEFETYRAEPNIEERFETYGMAYHRNAFRARRGAAAATEDGMRGVACSPGVVTGAVKVLRSPHDDMRLNGEILVAERTDPGWVPLYPSISGLLIERGSILSHSAIVAREMGIPTIVGIRGLTSMVKTGDVVTMDGSTGVVKL